MNSDWSLTSERLVTTETKKRALAKEKKLRRLEGREVESWRWQERFFSVKSPFKIVPMKVMAFIIQLNQVRYFSIVDLLFNVCEDIPINIKRDRG